MNRLPRSTAAIAAAVALTSCVASATTMRLWRDPSYKPAPVHRVFVVFGIPEQGLRGWPVLFRVPFENAIAQSLIGKGFEVATSSGVFPPGKLDSDKVAAYVKEMNVDLVVVPSLSSTVCQGSYQACIAVDTNVYAARNPEVPIWNGISSTFAFYSPQEAAAYLGPSLVEDLIQAQILVR
jgi:hypothetical protein